MVLIVSYYVKEPGSDAFGLFFEVDKSKYMFAYKKYLIKSTDQFDPEFFSFVGSDVNSIMDEIKHIACDDKAAFIMFFLKDGGRPNDWEKLNPELVELVRTKSLSSGNIESLFKSCINNPVFVQQLETYIKGRIAEKCD